MEFKIPVDELQGIISRLSNVVKVNESGITGMILIDAGDDVKFKATDGNVNLVVTAKEVEVIEKGKVLLNLDKIKGYIMKFIPLIEDYGTKDFHFVVSDKLGLIKTKTCFQSGKPAYKKLKFDKN